MDQSNGVTELQNFGVKRPVCAFTMQTIFAIINVSGNYITSGAYCKVAVLSRQLCSTRREFFGETFDLINLDVSEGPLTQLAKEINLTCMIAQNDDPTDIFHLDKPQLLCFSVKFQLKDFVKPMTISTVHFLINMASVKNMDGRFKAALMARLTRRSCLLHNRLMYHLVLTPWALILIHYPYSWPTRKARKISRSVLGYPNCQISCLL
jgi:hypothetical protein